MKNENFITILGWMVNELKLQGNELLCYALIYGFSQDGSSVFNGSRKYIAELIGAKSLNTVDSVLKNLVDKKLIIKESSNINGVIFNSYKVIIEKTNFKVCTPCSNNEYPHSKFEHNNNSNIDSNEEKEIDKSISKKKKNKTFDVRADLSYVDDVFLDVWNEWLDYKDEIGKQYKTQRGANSQYKSLVKYANNNPILANAIVKRSIEHSWDGVFALTDKQVELFLSSKSPYSIDKNNEQPTTQQISETIIINGQVYK